MSDDEEMTVAPSCPACEGIDLVGHVQPENPEKPIYDGVLFWECLECGTKSHRWPEGDHRRAAAERFVSGHRR
jgi:Zn ribbon nucleic-acid-binding protein